MAAEGPQGLRRVLPLCGASPCVLRDREEQQDQGYEADEASGTVGVGAREDWGLQSFPRVIRAKVGFGSGAAQTVPAGAQLGSALPGLLSGALSFG